jgi:hypothetical protein
MTGDFASVAQRLRLLGINALRVPFTFSALADDLKDYSVFTACAVGDGTGWARHGLSSPTAHQVQ